MSQPRRGRSQTLRDGAIGVEQIQPLREVRDATVGALHRPPVRLYVAAHDAQQRRLARTVGTRQGDAFGAAYAELDTVVGKHLSPAKANLKPLTVKDGAPRGHVGVRQVD